MRPIIFRGKRVDNVEWVEGYYVKKGTLHCIVNDDYQMGWVVLPETVGQYTGLLDKNKKRIFEGDIVTVGRYKGNWIVQWSNASNGACFSLRRIEDDCPSPIRGKKEIIGSIHTTPELLK